jgi:hypothetical protein
MDPHKNIFYYYRGPSSKHGEKEHQVEDNSTKSLINLLENGGPEIQKAFFSCVNKDLKGTPKKFRLQVGQGESKPDAVIDFTNQLLLIEVKVRSDLDVPQLKRHLDEAQRRAKQTDEQIHLLVITGNDSDADTIQQENTLQQNEVTFKTWGQIYKVLNSVTLKKKESKEGFLLAEFLHYLELMNLKPFTEFSKDDFEYFYDMDDDYGQTLKGKVGTLAEELKKRSLTSIPEFSQDYPQLIPGHIKKNNSDGKRVWVKFANPTDKTPFKMSNFCITLSQESLSLNLVLSGQKRTKRNYPIFCLDQYLNNTEKAMKLFSKLGGMTLTVFERNDGRDGHPPAQGARDVWNSRIAIETEFLKTPEGVKFLRQVLKEIDFPGINIGPVYPKNEVIGKSKEKLIDEMAKQLPLLYDALKEIRGTK